MTPVTPMTAPKTLLAGAVALALTAAISPRPAPMTVPASPAGPSTDITSADLLNAASGCGLERWAIKVGSDAQRGLVSIVQHQTTIAALRTLPKPRTLPSTRIRPTEISEYVTGGTLLRYKLEGDGDLHLVLADSGGRTLIVEIADPRCASASRFRTEITAVRKQFLARFTPTDRFQSTHTRLRVRGIGFFDFLHGQSGVAPNGIELHPVLGLGFSTTAPVPPTNSPTSSPSPGPTNTAGPSSSPSPTSSCRTSQPCITSISDPAPRGSTATATVTGATPRSTCTLSVTLPSGSQSQSAGLGQATSDSSGTASWSWTIGSNTTPGTGNAHVACQNGSSDRTFQIT